MLRKMTAIGMALGLLLPASAILAQTAPQQKENRARTEKQEMVQTGSQAVGDQERIQDQTRTREEKQARDQSGEATKQTKKKGSSPKTAGDQTRDKDQVRDRDRDRIHPGSGTQNRGGGR
ncbi:MAG: hypothetical protein HGB21_02870 [Nitrospirae bacterium]|nr:hypothetical protein [Nitrospirota bacterium]